MSKNKHQLEVIWIGLPNLVGHSYTDTLKALGYKTFDIMAIFNKNQTQEWKDIFLRRRDYNFELYGDSNATIHLVKYFYKELLNEYPNAKFIVHNMDSETWLEHFKKLQRAIRFLTFLRFFKRTRILLEFIKLNTLAVSETPIYRKNPQKAWISNLEEIKATIPQQQLLLLSAEEGWQPICDFLDKPVPSTPFPIASHKSITNRVHRKLIFNKSTRGQVIIILYFLILISLFVYLGFFY